MTYKIESTTYCANGLAPRWTWWIHGVAGTPRFGVVGTDEHGNGLFLFQHHGDGKPHSEQLLDAAQFSLPLHISKAEAIARLTQALMSLGWPPAADIMSRPA